LGNNYNMEKIILFISAFVPMYILFLVNLIVELINQNLSFNITNTIVLVSLVILIVVGVVGLLFIINYKHEPSSVVSIIKKKNITDQHFLNYFSLFVLLALTFDLSKICFICTLIVILMFIGIVYVKNNIYYVNPLLNILGYSFYDIVYKDSSGKECEMRIFFKGKITCGDVKYRIYLSKRNLNFLREYKCD